MGGVSGFQFIFIISGKDTLLTVKKNLFYENKSLLLASIPCEALYPASPSSDRQRVSFLVAQH